jgi:hypothetical protein
MKDIPIWVVDCEHIARPKNPFSPTQSFTIDNGDWDHEINPYYTMFETFAIQNTILCSPTIPPGEYKNDDVEVVWQICMSYTEEMLPKPEAWVNCAYEDAISDERAGWNTRQFLQLKQMAHTNVPNILHDQDQEEYYQLLGKRFDAIENIASVWADVEEMILTSQMLGFSPKTKDELLTELNNNYIISRR